LIITKFYGGPLDLRHFDIKDSWLFPFEVRLLPGKYSLLNFDVLRVGNWPKDKDSVLVDLTPDDYYKLGLKNPRELVDNNGLIIRLNPNQLYFPVFPDRRGDFNLEEFKRTLFGFLSYLGISQYPTEEEIVNYLKWYNLGGITKLEELGRFCIRKRTLGDFSVWDVLDGSFSSFPFFQVFRRG